MWFYLCVCIDFFIICLQGIPENERRTTKAESAWLFRIWYNFDHKYPWEKNGSPDTDNYNLMEWLFWPFPSWSSI